MAKRRKKAKKKVGRKNPKRVAAGRKAARARWGTGAKSSHPGKKATRKKAASIRTKAKSIEKLAASIAKMH